ncbi:MAG: DUF559 domain-containing protein [Actinomycetota bacterium]|nr:DUF559 domain-containing protein [Actinomycetota bacterium]
MDEEFIRVLAVHASEQHGLVTSEQAVAVLGKGRTARWVRSGRLVRVQPRVLRMAGAPSTWHQQLLAAQLGAEGIVSHRSAAELWGVLPPAGYVEVSIRAPRQVDLWAPAVAHRIKDLHPNLAVGRAGLLVTDPVRTLVDLGLVVPTWSVSRALTRALTTKLVTLAEVDELRGAIGRPGRNGTGVMRSVLEARRDGEESVLEAAFVDLIRRFGLPEPVLQHEVWDRGRFVARLDAAYPDRRVGIELDGYATHSDPEAFQRDRTRQNELTRLGWALLRFTWADVMHRSEVTAQGVRRLLANRPAA